MRRVIFVSVLLLTITMLEKRSYALAQDEQTKFCINDTKFDWKILSPETKFEQMIKVKSVDCKVTPSYNYDHEPTSFIEVSVSIASDVGSKLPFRRVLLASAQSAQKISKKEACEPANEFKDYVARNNYIVPAVITNQGLVKHEWISTQNGVSIHQYLFEDISVEFGGRFTYTRQARKEIIHPYCRGIVKRRN